MATMATKASSPTGTHEVAYSAASKLSYRDRNRPKQAPKRLHENTVRRRCGRARQLFQAAVRYRLIDRNPFSELKGVSVLANKSREYFITRAAADAVLTACPDAQWKLLFALSRYGGLRCPSEILTLRWGDIDFERNRIVVRSPKTEHHEGKDFRVVPLFPELRPYLQAVLDELLADFDPKTHRLSEQPVIARYRDVNANLRTQLLRILAKAGVKPWPKLFQNLRASRATELAAAFPGHVAAAWLGHSTTVAQKYYWQVTDADFDRATRLGDVVQNPVQSTAESTRNTSSTNMPIVLSTDGYDPLPNVTTLPMAEAGLEPARGLPPTGF